MNALTWLRAVCTTTRLAIVGFWRTAFGFRICIGVGLLGAVVLSLALPFPGFTTYYSPEVPRDLARIGQFKNSHMPMVRDVMFSEAAFAAVAEPLRSRLIAATRAINANDLDNVEGLLEGQDPDDASVQLVRGTAAVGSSNWEEFAKGVEWLKNSAASGNASATTILGVALLAAGTAPPAQLDLGKQYLHQAANSGDANACYVLASGYIRGWIGQVDLTAGSALMRRAAERGHTEAMFQYGIMLVKGLGVPKNAVEGERWMLRAAELGHAGAQSEFGLGRLSEYDHGLTTDAGPAIEWLSRAADQGEANAMFWLGTLYRRSTPSSGYYVPDRGVELLRKCSEQTLDDRCTFAYAATLEYGRDAPLDLVRAYAFYRLSNGAKDTRSGTERLASLERRLSEQDLTIGRELARQVRNQYFDQDRLQLIEKLSRIPNF